MYLFICLIVIVQFFLILYKVHINQVQKEKIIKKQEPKKKKLIMKMNYLNKVVKLLIKMKLYLNIFYQLMMVIILDWKIKEKVL